MKKKTIAAGMFLGEMAFLFCGCSRKVGIGKADFPKVNRMEENEAVLQEEKEAEIFSEEKSYPVLEDYGSIETTYQSVTAENGDEIFYYEIEEFYFNDTHPASWNETLRGFYKTIYEEYERDYAAYRPDYESYEAYYLENFGYEPEFSVEYNCDHDGFFVNSMSCFDDQYVCLQMNDTIYFSGAAHPSSCYIGFIMDVETGKRVTPLEVTGCSEEELLLLVNEQLSERGYATYESYEDFANENTCYVEEDQIIFEYSFNTHTEPIELPRTKE